FLPGIEWHLEQVEGVADGGRLVVRGPNVMLGHLIAERPGELVRPRTERGDGWYDTGDVVTVDAEGFVRISGRVKRFAKIGGEMISLTAVERIVARAWPDAEHAVVSVPDSQKGEQLVLLTTRAGAARPELQAQARTDGFSELHVPRKIVVFAKLP